MKKSRFTDAQIMAILRQAEEGIPVLNLCREHQMSSATFYKWRAKYGGMSWPPPLALRQPSPWWIS
jgi:putative transposase